MLKKRRALHSLGKKSGVWFLSPRIPCSWALRACGSDRPVLPLVQRGRGGPSWERAVSIPGREPGGPSMSTPCHSPTPSFQIAGRGRVLTEKRSWEMGHGEGREAPRGNEHWGLLSQGPQRSHTWWKRLFLTMSSTTCR